MSSAEPGGADAAGAAGDKPAGRWQRFTSAIVRTENELSFIKGLGIVALPGAFLAKTFVERMPVHMHTAILDAVVLLGGVFLVYGALR